MKKTKFIHLKLSTLIVSLLFLLQCVGCTQKNEDGNLKVFHGFEKDDVKTWDPVNAYDSVSLDMVPLIYETLYQYSYLSETYRIEPLLAAELPRLSSDQLTLTIPIKKGIKFQNDPCFKENHGEGRELTAKDFVYGINRLALPSLQSQGWWILDGNIVGANAFHEALLQAPKDQVARVFAQGFEGVKAIDLYTLQIKLTKPYPSLLYILTMNFTSPVPHEAVEMYGDSQGNLLDHPVGTGPFLLAQWDRNRQIKLVKNPHFRGEKYPLEAASSFAQVGMSVDQGKNLPFLDEIKFEVIKEDQPRWLNFLKGKVDAIPLPKDNFKQAIVNQVNLAPEFVKQGIHLNIEAGAVIRYIQFNMKDPVLGKNKLLRQALSSVIDRDQWVSIFTNGTGKKMVNAIPPGIADRPQTDRMKYDYDLVRARKLLAQAGYPEGKGLPQLKFDLRGASSTDRQFGEFITQQFAKIGVRLEVVSNTFPAYLEKAKQGALQISSGGWSMDFPDADNIYQLLYGPNRSPGPNETSFDHVEFNRLYEQAESLKPGLKRSQILQKMDDLLQEECPWAFGYYEAEYDLSHPWVKNYRANKIILNKLKYYRIDTEMKQRYREGR